MGGLLVPGDRVDIIVSYMDAQVDLNAPPLSEEPGAEIFERSPTKRTREASRHGRKMVNSLPSPTVDRTRRAPW